MPSFGKILAKIFGTRNDRMLSSLQPTVAAVESYEEKMKALSDEDLKAYTQQFKLQLSEGKNLDDILPEAFAVVREASVRVLGMKHFKVQVIGGIALHKGWISEAKTGEGKTLMATLPCYLNALTGKGVHVIVPNAYLAQRDAEEMGKIHQFLGLSVAAVTADDSFEDKKTAYQSDIVYTTNHAMGFDYLRDNMRSSNENKLIPGLNFCIVDEVDSILIDDARTPLIITGPSDTSSELYAHIYKLIDTLSVNTEQSPGDVEVNLKDKQVFLSERGQDVVQESLTHDGHISEGSSLFDLENTTISHYISACLKGKYLFQLDVEYVIDDDQIVIIDESTGRKATGRRWGNGIHQAVEAKEGVEIRPETQTLASITYQNLFRQYAKLSGMTGTADTEATELKDIYGLDVLVIPPNKPLARVDLSDVVYLTHSEKTHAIVEEVKSRHENKQPILIGTASIEYSEQLSTHLKKEGIPHQVLNAKYHEKEAQIILEAGRLGAVTIATNMAGRGTDIVLGGCRLTNKEWEEEHAAVLKAGGLHVLGTERHESRRIDNQLRGRSGRQGDVGSSQFYLSFDDRLIKRFASESIVKMLKKLGEEDEPISAPILTRSIENAQKNVESKYYDARREVLKLDDVANHQRQIIYDQRNELLATESISEIIEGMTAFAAQALCTQFLGEEDAATQRNLKGLTQTLNDQYHIEASFSSSDSIAITQEKVKKSILDALANKSILYGEERLKELEKKALLFVLDQCWKEHLSAMDHLKQGINFRSYAQKNPTHEYKKDSFALFEAMLRKIKTHTLQKLCQLQVPKPAPAYRAGAYAIHINPRNEHA